MRSIRIVLATAACLLALSTLSACGESKSGGESTTPRTLTREERIESTRETLRRIQSMMDNTTDYDQLQALCEKFNQVRQELEDL